MGLETTSLIMLADFDSKQINGDQLILLKENNRLVLKGDKVKKYLLPVYTTVIYPRTIDEIFNLLVHSHNVAEDEKGDFVSFLEVLIQKGIIYYIPSSFIGYGKNRFINNNLQPYHYKLKKNIDTVNVAIVDTTNSENILYLIDPLSANDKIKLDLYINAGDQFSAWLMDLLENRSANIHIFDYADYSYTAQLSSAHLIILIQNQFDNSLTDEVNDIAIKESIPLLKCTITEKIALIGPFVLPGKMPCLKCVKQNDIYNKINQSYNSREFIISSGPGISLMCYGILLEEIVRYLCLRQFNVPLNTAGGILIADFINYDFNNHRIIMFASCECCS